MSKKLIKASAVILLSAAILSGCSNADNNSSIDTENLKQITADINIEKGYVGFDAELLNGSITEISEDEVKELDALFKKTSAPSDTKVETREWNVYACKSAKSNLSKTEASFYDRLGEICKDFLAKSLKDTAEFSGKNVLKGAKYSDLGLTSQQAADVCFWFRLNEPQYFFLDNSVLCSADSVYFALGDYFMSLDDPAKTLNDTFSKLDGWISECTDDETTVWEKISSANKIICENTALASENSASERKNQSMYSVLMTSDAICTGYALTFCAMANAMEIDTFSAVGADNIRNAAKLGDKYYFVDVCRNDEENGYSEKFMGIGTDYAAYLDSSAGTHADSDKYDSRLPSISKTDYEPNDQKISSLKLSASGSGKSAAKAEWNAAENAEYYEYRVCNGVNIISDGTTEDTFIYAAVPLNAKSVDIKVRAVGNENGRIIYSDWAEITASAAFSASNPAEPSDVKAEHRAGEGIAIAWKNDEKADGWLFLRMNSSLTEILYIEFISDFNGVFWKGLEPTEDCYFSIMSVKIFDSGELYSNPVSIIYNINDGMRAFEETETGDNVMKNFSDGVYVGEIKDGKRNGNGTMTYSNGNEYSGGWKDDIQSGEGVFTWANGDVYEGNFDSGKMSGQGKKTTKFANGEISVIEGVFEDGMVSGQIKMDYTFADGTKFVYEGEYQNEGLNGTGKKTTYYADGTSVLDEGKFVNGNLSGTAIRTVKYSSGNVYLYEGDFIDGQFTCTGVRTINYKSGHKSVLEGDFTDGEANGTVKLTYTFSRGSVFVYEGEYSNGNMNGQGVKTTSNSDKTSIVEEGTFKNDKLYNGTYTYYNADGSVRTKRNYVNGTAI